HTCSACKLLKFRSRLLLGFGVFSAFTGSVQAAELRNFLNNLNPLLIATPGHQTDFLGAEAQLVQRANASLNAALSSTLDTTVFNPSVIGLSFDVTQGLPVRTIESLG